MSKYICSKLSADVKYTIWHDVKSNANDMPRQDKYVLVKGGSGVADKNLYTPAGVVTEITDEQFDVLQNCKVFLRHQKAGYVTVLDKSPSQKEINSISDDLNTSKSAPLTPKSMEKKSAFEYKEPKKAEDSEEAKAKRGRPKKEEI